MKKTQIITSMLIGASAFAYAQNGNDAATAVNQKTEVALLQAQAKERQAADLGEEAEIPSSQKIWSERESLFINGLVEENLSNTGFAPSLVWTAEGWNNVSGGNRDAGPTSQLNSLVTIGLEQDLSTLFGIDNAGTIAMTGFWNANSNKGAFDDSINGGNAASNIFGPDMTRVFEIYYANSIETSGGTFSTRIGQLAADEDFMGVDYADLFIAGSFGAMPAVASIGNDYGAGFSQYALATLGVTLAYELEDFSFIVGIYNGNVGTDDGSANHGFDYELQDMAIWYQAGYSYELFGQSGAVMAGGNYHSGEFENFETGGTSEGFYSFYFGLSQALISDEESNPILGAFLRAGFAPKHSISGEETYLDLGLNWFSPLAGREDDAIGIAYSLIDYNDDVSPVKTSSMVEVTYKCQLTPAIMLQPVAQVYFDAYDESTNEVETCLVVGARFEVAF